MRFRIKKYTLAGSNNSKTVNKIKNKEITNPSILVNNNNFFNPKIIII